MNFDYKILEEKMKLAPANIQEALTSTQLTEMIKGIATKFELKIDQESTLFDCVAYVMLGLMAPKDFTENFSKESGVNAQVSKMIVESLNKEVLGGFKVFLQDNESDSVLIKSQIQTENVPPSTNTTLERVGNFSIEPTIGEGSDGSTGPGTHWKEVTAADRNKILAGVEDPGKLGGTSSSSRSEESHAEPIVDYLLQNSIGQRERTDVVSHTHASATPPTNLPVVGTSTVTAKSTPPVSTLVVPSSTPPKPILQTSTTPPVKTPAAPPRSGPDPYHEPVA